MQSHCPTAKRGSVIWYKYIYIYIYINKDLDRVTLSITGKVI